MLKNIFFTILALFAIVGLLGGAKFMQINDLISAAATMEMPPISVATEIAELQDWEMNLNAVGSLEAVQGVVVTAEVPGRVSDIQFQPGAQVALGQVLLEQDISSEEAQLRAAEATVELARLNLRRIEELLNKKAASQSDLDTAKARYKEAVAQADSTRAIIAKKTMKAPFAGRLGVRLVNLGQDLASGTAIVSLQNVDSMFVNFSIPQQHFSSLALGLKVVVRSDAVPKKSFTGQISAISPEVDAATRNIRVQATLANPEQTLLPGMFANVAVILPESERVLAVPGTAIAYATYGDSLFVVEEQENEQGKTLVARQQFVQLGRRLGDFVAVEKGLNKGQQVVVAGVFKLQNGATIAINNDVKPRFSLTPTPEDQ